MLTIFSLSFLTFKSRKPFKSPCSPHGIFITRWFEHFMLSNAVFPEFEPNFNANAFFLQIIH
jgi:hypothetical protein